MNKDPGTSSTLLALPPTGASLQGIGETFRTDLYTGTGAYAIPLDLPAAQNGFKPELFLQYSTGAGNGPFGHGWDVSLMAIQRSLRRGFPTYDDASDGFVFNDDLVPVGNGFYRPRCDTKAWRIRRVDDSWTVTTKDGVVHTLGATPNSRVQHPADVGVFSWLIERMTTPTGQQATFSYVHDGGVAIPDTITYGPFRVIFEYELRPDRFVSRRTGFPLIHGLRCREIRIESDRSTRRWLRRYLLEYANDAGDSQLCRVVLEAGEGAERVSMPDARFGYGAWSAGEIYTIDVRHDGSLPALGNGTVDLVDLDGSGRPGVIQGTAAGWVYWSNLGRGAFGAPRILPNVPPAMSLDDHRVRFLDLEANGTVDLLWAQPGSSGFFPNSAGGRWEDFVPYRSDVPFDLTDPELRLYDADGDGKIDVLVSRPHEFLVFLNLGREGWSGEAIRVPRRHDPASFPDVSLSAPEVFTADMSGDGLTDIVVVRNGSFAYWPCEGLGRWSDRIEMTNPPLLPPDDFAPRNVTLIDLDGDGLADFVYLGVDEVLVWFNQHGVRWSGPISVPAPGLSREDAVVVDLNGDGRPGVFWSSGIAGSRRHRFLRLGAGPDHRLLTKIQGELGHTTHISYGTSIAHRQRDEDLGQPWRTFLPSSLPVVDSIECLDGPGGIKAITQFQYRDGHFDGIERMFNGFGTVQQTVSGDDTSPSVTTRTDYHPGTDPTMPEAERRQLDPDDRLSKRALKGTPLRIDRYEQHPDATWVLKEVSHHHVDTRIEHRIGAARVVVPFAVSATTDEHDLVRGGGRRTIVRHGKPDQIGNPTWMETEAGTLSPDGEYKVDGLHREVLDYISRPTPTASPWMPGLLRQRSTLDARGQVIACVRIFYDGTQFEGLPNGEAERGVVTRIEELVRRAEFGPAGTDEMAVLGHHYLSGPGIATAGWYRNRSRTANMPSGQVTAVRDALGNESTITYDEWQIDPVRSEDAEGLATNAIVDRSVERVSAVTNPSGVTERRIYDALGRCRRVLRTTQSGALELVAVVRHDAGDFNNSGTRPPSITTLTPWEAGRDPAELEDPSLPLGTLTAVTVMRRFYAASGIEIGAVSSGPVREDGRRLPVHSGERRLNAQGKVAAEGRPRSVASFASLPRGMSKTLYSRAYDGSGREVEISFPAGHREQRFEPLRTLLADANAVAAGVQDGVIREFDSLGRMVSVRERIDSSSFAQHYFDYSTEHRIEHVRDEAGDLLIDYSYDCLGRRTRMRHRDLGEHTYAYDAVGNLVCSRHPTGGRTEFSYDRIMRLVGVRRYRPDDTLESTDRFHYDASPNGQSICGGRLCAIEDDAGTTVFHYTADGRLAKKERTTPEGKRLAFSFEYNFRGLVSAIEYPDRTRIAYEYGAEGEVVRIDGIIDRFGYDERGRPTLIVYANGVESRFDYDDSERLAAIATGGRNGLLARFAQTYDAVGNPTFTSAQIAGALDEERRLDYDALNRLIASRWGSGQATIAHRFAYDGSGNVLENSEHGIARCLYEDKARTGLLTGLVMTSGSETRDRRYDAAGRLIASETLTELGWNTADRLIRCATRSGHVEEMRYDAHGHRARIRTEPNDGSTPFARDIFDDLYEETADERVVYVRGVGGVVAVLRTRTGGQEAAFWHHDPQGNLRLCTDTRGSITARFSYTSFGLDVAFLSLRGAFTGKTPDKAIGLIQLGARYYEPLTARFISGDLLVVERPDLALADPSLFNVYGYSLNNPYRFRDPRGRFVWLVVIAGALIGGAIGYQTAKENGENPWVGALVGGLVGGLVGAAGAPFLAAALKGAALNAGFAWATGGTSRDIWTGAAVGFAFGALGEVVSGWLPVAGGDSIGSMTANAMIEIGSDALIGGLAGGTYSALQGRSFEDGFRGGLVIGAAMSAAKVALLGVRYDPSSIKQDFHAEAAKQFGRQNVHDNSYLAADVAKAGMPNPSSVTFRTGGILSYLNGGRAFALGDMVSTDSGTMNELRQGSVNTLAHELRHIAQQRAATFGVVEFLSVWLFQQVTSDQHYQPGPGNTTLEPYYQ
ncbi:VCBS repeat-containing protein [Rhodoferax sp. AJA081-3]|uniref:SpvB/TcaC N-terminal domain-containing protein n=1 Tax=Rhodoferax sp. AJA081-3 TaxID=2752316 RepID=UPI001AE05AB2|nr:SpvB/TcaC N-terminal domain-containing protein [Rhodoferax sp. AJA081-3]QTN26503.1 VCBS repeat-containing protein [Rhodoferax sp. AJA081-3]